MTFSRSTKEILLLVVVVILSRLPQLFSENLLLDGDECISGLMARHLYEGRELPLFFYGQSYGFSLIELLCINLFHFIFGITDLWVRLSMLFLWMIGVVFFYKTLREIQPISLLPLLITLLLVLSPPWAAWSMKARGGYLTAFTLSSMILYFIFNIRSSTGIAIHFLTGLLLVLISQSQPLWIPGLLPLIGYSLYKAGGWKPIALTTLGILIGTLFFAYYKKNITAFWSPDVFAMPNSIPENLFNLPRNIFYSLTGAYNNYEWFELNTLTNFLAAVYTGALLLMPLLTVALIVLKKIQPSLLLFAVLCSHLATIGILLIMNGVPSRYFLPGMGFFLLYLFVFLINYPLKKRTTYSFAVMIFLGAISVFSFKDLKAEPQSRQQLKTFVAYLQEHKLTCLFCEDGLLQWQIMFYSGEKVLARYKNNTDRYPPYITKVNKAFKRGEKTTAFVGFRPHQPEKYPSRTTIIENTYFVIAEPDSNLLLAHDFNLETVK